MKYWPDYDSTYLSVSLAGDFKNAIGASTSATPASGEIAFHYRYWWRNSDTIARLKGGSKVEVWGGISIAANGGTITSKNPADFTTGLLVGGAGGTSVFATAITNPNWWRSSNDVNSYDMLGLFVSFYYSIGSKWQNLPTDSSKTATLFALDVTPALTLIDYPNKSNHPSNNSFNFYLLGGFSLRWLTGNAGDMPQPYLGTDRNVFAGFTVGTVFKINSLIVGVYLPMLAHWGPRVSGITDGSGYFKITVPVDAFQL